MAELSAFEQTLLQAIEDLRPNASGMTLRRTAEERTGRSVSIGTIYTTLERLEERGYVRSWQGEATPERGMQRKRLWTIAKDWK